MGRQEPLRPAGGREPAHVPPALFCGLGREPQSFCRYPGIIPGNPFGYRAAQGR